MKEKEFIHHNKDKWAAFEAEIKKSKSDPRVTTRSYIEMMDDLSYSRTHYPNRMVRSYLNGVAQLLSVIIYRSQNNTVKNLKTFWLRDLPLVMYHSQRHLLIAFLIFASSMGIGIYSCIEDPDFANYILGDGYVNMTIENIEKGDPMAVYKDDDETGMFLRITLNNILVSVRTYVFSFFFGFGTILILLYNGVMVGAFQYFFIERGLFWESFLTIWQHGTIEISSIVLAGTAGLVLSEGILFPGTYSRLDGLRRSGRKSMMIAVGIMPLLFLSGAIEAFITRLTETPDIIRLISILICLTYMIYYFIIYPRKIAKREKLETVLKMNSLPIKLEAFDENQINAVPTTMAMGMFEVFKRPKAYLGWMVIPSIFAALLFTWIKTSFRFGYDEHLSATYSAFDLFSFGFQPALFILNSTLIIVAFLAAGYLTTKFCGKKIKPIRFLFKYILWATLSGVLTALSLSYGWSIVLVFPFVTLMMLMLVSAVFGNQKIASVFNYSFKILKIGAVRFLGLSSILFFTYLALALIADNLILDMITDAINQFLPLSIPQKANANFFMSVFVNMILMSSMLTKWFLSISFNYFSIRESRTSLSLRERLSKAFELKTISEKVNFTKQAYHQTR